MTHDQRKKGAVFYVVISNVCLKGSQLNSIIER